MSSMKNLWPLVLLALVAARRAPAPAHDSDGAVEQSVRQWLAGRTFPAAAQPLAGFSAQDREGLKDSVSSARPMPAPPPLRDLPGLSAEPFDVCRTLERCWPLPTSFHVESPALIGDAVTALLRPWIALGKARGWRFSFGPAGAAPAMLTASLDGLPEVRLSVASAAVRTGGYDVWLDEAGDAPAVFERERLTVLATR